MYIHLSPLKMVFQNPTEMLLLNKLKSCPKMQLKRFIFLTIPPKRKPN